MIKVTKMNSDTVLTDRVVYIGRGNSQILHSPLANPFKISATCSRDESIAQYETWLFQAIGSRNEQVIKELNRLYFLAKTGDLELVCYCKPLACHGDVIKRVLDNALEERSTRISSNGGPVTIVAGSRTATRDDVYRAIEEAPFTPGIVVSGTARGADTFGEMWASDHGRVVKRFPANWDLHGRSAGYRRNEEMAQNAEALIAVWDGKSPGTKHMIDLANKRGLRIYIHYI